MKWKGKEAKMLRTIDSYWYVVLICELADGTFVASGVYSVIARRDECEFLTAAFG